VFIEGKDDGGGGGNWWQLEL